MKNCLVTKLKSTVSDSSLIKIGELVIPLRQYSSTEGYRTLLVRWSATPFQYRIIYDDGTSLESEVFNPTIDPEAGYAQKSIVVENKPGKLYLSNRYNIFALIQDYEANNFEAIDCSDASYMSSVTRIDNVKLKGNIENLKTSLSSINRLYVGTCPELYGDINVLDDTNISYLSLYGSRVSGNIIDVINSTPLVNIGFSSYQQRPDLSFIKNGFVVYNSAEGFLHKWTQERDSSYSIISLNEVNFGSDLDAMLVNQAACQASTSTNKTIRVRGSHTSETDIWQAAVTTLKGKGYTVIINDETL